MQSHGLTSFPDPNPGASFDIGGPTGKADSTAARAYAACRHLLSTTGTGATGTTAPATPSSVSTDCLSASRCYTPNQLLVAYGIQPLIARGITGRGQTVVLPEFPPSTTTQGPAVSDIRQDLADFDAKFHLSPARLQVVNTLAHKASPWLATGEEVADTEIVHAVAPDATIEEILIPSSDTASTATVTAAVLEALQLGLTKGQVISFSADAGEQCFTPAEVNQFNSVLQTAEHDHVTVVVSSGDTGAATDPCPGAGSSSAVKGVNLPASDPLALAVGGTSLHLSRSGTSSSETAWSSGGSSPEASGGGFSQLFPRPSYQDGIAGTGTTRGEVCLTSPRKSGRK